MKFHILKFENSHFQTIGLKASKTSLSFTLIIFIKRLVLSHLFMLYKSIFRTVGKKIGRNRRFPVIFTLTKTYIILGLCTL